MKYFAPLSSYKQKHDKMKNSLDFIKIGNYAVVNINNMSPVPDGEYTYVNREGGRTVGSGRVATVIE
jgi:translation elongation factor EF-Tu-like GTPase